MRLRPRKKPRPQEKKVNKTTKQHHKQPQVAVNNLPENQDTFKKPNVLSSKKSHVETVKENSASKNEETCHNKNKPLGTNGSSDKK